MDFIIYISLFSNNVTSTVVGISYWELLQFMLPVPFLSMMQFH
jgi:hypothetical protein